MILQRWLDKLYDRILGFPDDVDPLSREIHRYHAIHWSNVCHYQNRDCHWMEDGVVRECQDWRTCQLRPEAKLTGWLALFNLFARNGRE